MEKIKFSKEYPKLHGQVTAKLIGIEFIKPSDFPLNQDLLDYDTKAIDGSYYPLPKNQYLQLIFLGNKKIPFCTIRRFTIEKGIYYRKLIGKEFELIREFEGGKND